MASAEFFYYGPKVFAAPAVNAVATTRCCGFHPCRSRYGKLRSTSNLLVICMGETHSQGWRRRRIEVPYHCLEVGWQIKSTISHMGRCSEKAQMSSKIHKDFTTFVCRLTFDLISKLVGHGYFLCVSIHPRSALLMLLSEFVTGGIIGSESTAPGQPTRFPPLFVLRPTALHYHSTHVYDFWSRRWPVDLHCVIYFLFCIYLLDCKFVIVHKIW